MLCSGLYSYILKSPELVISLDRTLKAIYTRRGAESVDPQCSFNKSRDPVALNGDAVMYTGIEQLCGSGEALPAEQARRGCR